MCDKTVNTYPSTIKFVPECFMIQEMCNKAVNRCFIVSDSIPDQYDLYKTQEMCDRVVSENSLAASKLIPDWFAASKMIKNLISALCADENILYFNEYSDNVIFNCNEMGIMIIILMKLILILLFLSNF